MNVLEIYNGSNGEATKALYAKLESLGPEGIVAVNLFRACKASARAKVYSRRFKGDAYQKKQWSMANLCDVLAKHGQELGIVFGWKQDPAQEFYPWVLYVDLPNGQVSFHNATRLTGPDYQAEWNEHSDSATNIVRHCQCVFNKHFLKNETRCLPVHPGSLGEVAQEDCGNNTLGQCVPAITVQPALFP